MQVSFDTNLYTRPLQNRPNQQKQTNNTQEIPNTAKHACQAGPASVHFLSRPLAKKMLKNAFFMGTSLISLANTHIYTHPQIVMQMWFPVHSCRVHNAGNEAGSPTKKKQ
jgi:hypothetical protein